MRVLTRWLTRWAGRPLAESMLGDLDEERHRRARRYPRAARWWFWIAAVALVTAVPVRRAWQILRDAAGRGDRPLALAADLRDAWRAIRFPPGSSAAIVLVLSLGIGLTSTMFAFADRYVLRPLPYANPRALVSIEIDSRGLTRDTPLPTVEAWRARTDLFEDLAAIGDSELARIRLDDRTAFLWIENVSPNFFRVLGAPAPFDAAWADPSDRATSVVLLTRAETSLPPDSRRAGASLPRETGGAIRVAGVMPTFLFPGAGGNIQAIRAYAPGAVVVVAAWTDDGRPRVPATGRLIARLRPGVSPAVVTAALAMRLPSGSNLHVTVEPLTDVMTKESRPLAAGALAAALFVLAICAANAGNLLLARRVARSRELATRAALGASRADLVRLWLAELLLVALAAITGGVALAALAVSAATRVAPRQYVSLGAPTIDGRVLAAAVAMGAMVIVFGVALLWLHDRRQTTPFGRAIVHDGPRTVAFRRTAIAVQSAFAMILIIGGTLLARSYWNLVRQPKGLDPDVVAITAMYPPDVRDGTAREVIDRSIARLRAVPGVASVAVADGSIVNGVLVTRTTLRFTVDGANVEGQLQSVSDTYFSTAGMTFIAGRGLQGLDASLSPIVINESMARRCCADGSALGRTTSAGTIVGVVRDAFERQYDRAPIPTVYNRLSDRLAGSGAVLRGTPSSGVTYLLERNGTAAAYEEPVRRALFDVRPDAVVVEMNTLGDKLSNTVRDRTFAALVLTLFGAAGVAITLAGLVGVVVIVVSRRTREIAIRLAVGAQAAHIRRLVAGDVLASAALGAIAGLVAGRWLSLSLSGLVYGVDAGSWPTALAAGAAMLLLILAAALVPARRATALQPSEALRVE